MRNAEDRAKHPIELFTDVAPRYEWMNTLMTAGRDQAWRRSILNFAQSTLEQKQPSRILDLATGTGDFPRLMAKKWPKAEIIGTDPNQAMLNQAIQSVDSYSKKIPSLENVRWEIGRGEELNIESESVELVTIGFGFRNISEETRLDCVREVYRCLKPGGAFAILELGMPRPGLFRRFFSLLLFNVMPFFIGLFSPKDSYEYLAESIAKFPEPEKVRSMLELEGFIGFSPVALSGGLCWAFIGKKPTYFCP